MSRSDKGGQTATAKVIKDIDLHCIVSNKENGRFPVRPLARIGYGVFERLTPEDAKFLNIHKLALSKDQVKALASAEGTAAGGTEDEITARIAELTEKYTGELAYTILPPLMSLALSSDPAKQAEFVGLIDQYELEEGGQRETEAGVSKNSIPLMADNISSLGQLQNCGVVAIAGDSKFDLVWGARRALAAAYRHAKSGGTIPATITSEIVDGENLLEMALSENVMRQDMTPMEEGRLFRALQRGTYPGQNGTKMKVNEIGEKFNLDHQVVRLRIKLCDLEPEVQQKVQDGRLGVVRALATKTGKEKPDATKPDNRRRMPTLKQAEQIYGDVDGSSDAFKEFGCEGLSDNEFNAVRKWLHGLLWTDGSVEYATRSHLKSRQEAEVKAAQKAEEARKAAAAAEQEETETAATGS